LVGNRSCDVPTILLPGKNLADRKFLLGFPSFLELEFLMKVESRAGLSGFTAGCDACRDRADSPRLGSKRFAGVHRNTHG
jgi:hypothetical protein